MHSGRRRTPGEVSMLRDPTVIRPPSAGAWKAQTAGTHRRGQAGNQVVVGDIPREAPGFQPRPDLLTELDRVDHGVQVLTGRLGAGSTQLAAAYARAKLAAGWRLVAWVNAGNTGNLLAGLAAVAEAAGLPDGGSRRDAAAAGRMVRHWLENDGDHCLLVFDEAENPDMLREFVPVGATRVLITSTRPPSANLQTSVPVDVFSAGQALTFLAGPTGLDDTGEAAAVAAEVGHLPLALALAAAVTAGHRLAYGAYLHRLRTLPVEEYLTRPEGQAYSQGVAAAVLLSLQAARAADRVGVNARTLEILAVLSAAGIRREVLHTAGQAGVLASGGHRVPAAMVDRALEWLSHQSLLSVSLDGQTVIMHRLVARVVRDWLARRGRLAVVCRAAASVLEAHAIALGRSQDRPAVRDIPQQVAALLENTAGLAGEADKELARILLRLRFVALYHLIELGDSTLQAIAVGEPLTSDLERLLGPDHRDTLNSRNSLAAAYLAAGRVAEAIPLFEQTLAARERLLGPEHSDTLTSRNNLASAYQDAGRAGEAVQLYELNLAARERLLGVGHPRTLSSRSNLAAAYRAAGRVAEAISLFEQTRADRERVLGADHPDTRASRKNLAIAQDGDQVDEAIPLFEQTSSGWPRILRPAHPDIETSRKNLANAYWDGGQVADAIPPAEEVLAARESQPPADAAAQVLPVVFRWPPGDLVGRLLPDGTARPSARLNGHSSHSRAQSPSAIDVQRDREAVAVITSGDPAGVAMAYDRHAAALYGYCHWMLDDSADAAGALQDTFVIAVATLGDLAEPSKLRAWLFALARNECQRRIWARSATRDEETDAARRRTDAADRLIDATMPFRALSGPANEPIDATVSFRALSGPANEPIDATMSFRALSGPANEPIDATMSFRAVSRPADATGSLARVNGDEGQAELRAMIHSILAQLRPREREVIQLTLRHDLYGSDLAEVLGMSLSRTRALAARARARLEKALGALLVVRTGREACSVLGELLADWDGQLTGQTRDLVVSHVEQCQTCATHGPGALRPAALFGLLPLAPLRPELREQVLGRCSSTAEDAVAYRRWVARRAEPTLFARFAPAIRRVSWDSIRVNLGVVTATVAVAMWVVAAVSVILLTVAASRAAPARAAQPAVGSSSSHLAAAPALATSPASANARPSSAVSRPAAHRSYPARPSSPPPSRPSSPSPSHSPSSSPSPSHSPSSPPSHSPSPSPSPAHTASPSPSSSPSATA
jgi:RNA polymerase sigma factor (sigma-70 family)